MKLRLKKSLLKCYNNFLLVMIGLLGFSVACTKTGPVEYGTPSADYVINGVVKSQTNQPISNIKVVVSYDSINTNAEGKFSLKNKTFPGNHAFNIKLRDIDGAANGSYQDNDTTIAFNNNSYTNGDGHWYSGKVEQSVEIKLTSK